VIRFSAALVAVAIGVLIGGIATSKLLLVYIAIVVSAVALLVLAIGVVLKREELFGQGQGLVPVGVGPAPAVPATTGEGQVQPRQDAPVPPSDPFPRPTAAYGAAFGSTTFEGTASEGTPFESAAFAGAAQAAPPAAAAPPAEPSTSRRPTAGQGRDQLANPVPSWEAQSARDQWSSSSWQSGPAVGGTAVGSPVVGGTAAGSPAVDGTALDGPPDWMAGGRGANGPAVQAEETAPSSPAPPSSAEPETAPRSWFDKQPRRAETAQRVVAGTQSDAPADEAATPADEDDDWPTRYSWLDDDPLESEAPVGPDDDAGTRAADADSAPPTVSGPALDPAPPTVPASAFGSAPPTVSAPAVNPEPGNPEPGNPEPGNPEPRADLGTAVHTDQDAGSGRGTEPEPEPVLADAEPPSADAPDAAAAGALVAVLRGVPRYHQPDCVLIRFLPDDDIRRLPVAEAKADGCTPGGACQPAE